MTPKRPEGLRDTPAVLWIEKILFAHERLAGDWMTDGTTGYDFMNDVGAALHDPDGEAPLTEYWTATTGRPAEFETEAQAARRQILRESLASELFNTAAAIHRVLRRDMSTRDYTLTGVRGVLTEILVHFHTYRIYAGPGGISDADQRAMDWAMAGARRNVRQADRELLELVGAAGERHRAAGVAGRGTRRQEWQRAMVRFQLLSAPTAAKSVEDTAFYRYGAADLAQRGGERAVAVRAFGGRVPCGEQGAAAAVSEGAADHRDARPQAGRGCADAVGGGEQPAGGVGNGDGAVGCG